ncbi:hypothetical protein ElyMa_006184100 [Elysia marginata]|uniref:Uncharacterized protein n=1 Tax=Elysia marginata TaxID=1093978 RepID=A0AAV4H2E8_9GAST|nr:hypothetical protein ElyMa_006184100 [Elysia marginata]
MQYASTAWYPSLTEVHRNTLNTMHQSATRTILRCTRDTNITLVLNQANFLPPDVKNEIASAPPMNELRGSHLPTRYVQSPNHRKYNA